MKILHVLEYSIPKLVGYTIRSKYIIENQKKIGLDPLVVTSPLMQAGNSNHEQYELINDIRYYRTGIFNTISRNDGFIQRFLKRYNYSKKYLEEIIRIGRKEKPDIIHAHSSYLNGIRTNQAAKQLGVPSVFEVRGLWADTAVANQEIKEKSWKFKFVTYMEFRAMREASGVIAIAESLKSHLIKSGLDKNRLWVAPNGVDVKIFDPLQKDETLIQKLGIANKTVFGFIGSVRKIEGLELVIETFADLKGKNDAVFLLVGDGDNLPYLKERIDALKLGNHILTIGRVPHEDVLNFYSVMDVLVYPRIYSNVNNRVTPLKPLEAMAMGKTVLASDVSGLAELVKDNVNGFLFEHENKEDLKTKLENIIKHNVNLQLMGIKAREWVVKNRTWENIVNGYVDIYRSLL